MRRLILIFASYFVLLVAGENIGISTTAHGLEIGVAAVDITPPLGMPMRGYASRKELSNGIWDPLYAKSMVFDDGNKRAAFVVLDLIGPPPNDVCERIRRRAEEELQISTILFMAVHTHAGPDLKPDLPSKENPWLPTLERKLLHLC